VSWPGLKRTGLGAIFVLFSIGGLALAVFGAADDRFLGLALLLFFGGGGATWWLMTRPRRRLEGLQVGTVGVAGGREPAFIARTDPRVLRVAGMGAIAMGAGALVLAVPAGLELSDVERVLFAAGGVFFVGIGLFSLYRSANSPNLALTRRGVRATGPAGWFIPWDAIVGVGEIAVHDNPFLGIRVNDPAVVEMSRLPRVAQTAERSIMGTDVSFPLRTLTVDSAELGTAIGRYLEHPAERARIGRLDELTVIREAIPTEPATASAPEPERRGSVARALAIGSLFVVGGLLLLICAGVVFGDSGSGSAGSRLLGAALVGALALAQIVAAILLVRRHAAGRWLGIGSVVGLLALTIIALVRSEPDERLVGVIIGAILLVQLGLLAIGARDSAGEQATAELA
jgi:hypothetical protein